MRTLPRFLTPRTLRSLGDGVIDTGGAATTNVEKLGPPTLAPISQAPGSTTGSPSVLATSALGSLSPAAAASLAAQNPTVATTSIGGYALPSSPQAAQAGNMAAVCQAALELNAGSITQAQFDQIYAGLTVPPVISSSSAMPGADMNPAQTAPAVTAAASPYAYGGGDYSTSATDTDNGGRGSGGN